MCQPSPGDGAWLFLGKIQDQAGSYGTRAVHGRGARDLNRLRTLALTTNSLTNFRLVTPTSEDQRYFERFNVDANIDQYRELVTEAGDVLYNLQAAEQQAVEAQRLYIVNAAVLTLTSLSPHRRIDRRPHGSQPPRRRGRAPFSVIATALSPLADACFAGTPPGLPLAGVGAAG
jgi:hypothetical protein